MSNEFLRRMAAGMLCAMLLLLNSLLMYGMWDAWYDDSVVRMVWTATFLLYNCESLVRLAENEWREYQNRKALKDGTTS